MECSRLFQETACLAGKFMISYRCSMIFSSNQATVSRVFSRAVIDRWARRGEWWECHAPSWHKVGPLHISWWPMITAWELEIEWNWCYRICLVRVFYCFLHILRAFTLAHGIFVRKIWPSGTWVRLSAYVGALGCGVTGCTADHPLFCDFFLDYKQDPSWSSMCSLEVSAGPTAACIMLKHVPFLSSKSPYFCWVHLQVSWSHDVTCPFLWWQNLICFFPGWLDSARSSIHSILWWLSRFLFQRTWLPDVTSIC